MALESDNKLISMIDNLQSRIAQLAYNPIAIAIKRHFAPAAHVDPFGLFTCCRDRNSLTDWLAACA